ncbi:CHASE2 domain-containing protein [Microcoleus sp. FACHB-SPT15]|uniref:CHASE2 domain-containing protein n=1 Tax=Microcoleus sp. FACHB-SPT15 TaxID=2692830 RepID=UPI001782EEAB|nr:CHASE2 domain-containing protein [Microcoleus sp. FACHB-SPT15]MBD1809421.1 CHASE2 domain-containing protein [Microcoleus sp. FACHB-SPT15]
MKVTSGDLTQTSELKAPVKHQGNVRTKLSTAWSQVKRLSSSWLGHPALLASLTVTGLLLFARYQSWLEPWELSAYDRLLQLRPALPPDPRLLVVTITEADIQSQEKWPLTDAVVNQLLTKLEQYEPAVIGLDIYRDFPQQPGNAELSAKLQKSDRIIPVCKISDAETPGTPPPPSVPVERVGFADIAIDPNGIVRRGLLFLEPPDSSRCSSPSSFSFQLAQKYLETKGIQPELTKDKEPQLKFGNIVFKKLSPTDGGYQNADSGGYQILLNYRSSNTNSLAQSVTLTDVLNNRIDASWVKNRIVLIGVTAPSIDDAFFTPYSSQERLLRKMPGVVVHGQIVSQLLSAVLDGRPLFWFWSDWVEGLWIFGWSLVGGVLVLVIRHPGRLVLVELGALGLLLGTSILLFFESGWIPVVAPILGLIASGTSVLAYSAYQRHQELEESAKKAQEQKENIALLEALLKERAPTLPTTEPDESLTETTALPPDEDTGDTAVWTQGNGATVDKPIAPRPRTTHLLQGRYEKSRVLASGGFGLTYIANDTQRPGSPQCVVKQLRPARQDARFLEVARRLFATEAEILEKLGTHPQIPQLLAYFVENNEFYLVQEYIEGEPITEEMPVDKRLPEPHVVELVKGVLKILTFVHEHSVIHRDIKPGNIMRRKTDGQLVLIDFGAVKHIQPQQEGETVAIGTRGYAPPEQYAGHPNFSSDIYALGMIGIQALTGIATYQLPISQETGDVSWRHLANVSDEFAQILEKMVRYNFVARYNSATAVIEDLKTLRY